MVKYIDTEAEIINLFPKGKSFIYNNDKYTVNCCVKPRPSHGECKTDVYLSLTRDSDNQEIIYKISIKQDNADFLENKMSYDRAIEIFGHDATKIMKDAIKTIEASFKNDYLVYFSKYGKTEANTIKIGWKFELTNKISGNKSGKLNLTEKQIIDIYSGTNLSIDKKNSFVDGKQISNSGVANYMLIVTGNKFKNPEDCLSALVPIEDFVKDKEVYFACKAVNYRASKNKWDGDRPLSVWVDWSLKDGKLYGELNFSSPLQTKANVIGTNICAILADLKINNSNFKVLKSLLDDKIVYYP